LTEKITLRNSKKKKKYIQYTNSTKKSKSLSPEKKLSLYHPSAPCKDKKRNKSQERKKTKNK
jgi:hypothetical protein